MLNILEPALYTVFPERMSLIVICLKFLNDSKLIMSDYEDCSDSFTINVKLSRTFMGPLFLKQINNRETFFEALYLLLALMA